LGSYWNQYLPSRSVPSSPLHISIISFFFINPRALASLPWRSLPPVAVAKSCRSAFRKKIKRRAAGSQQPWLVILFSSTFGLRVSYLISSLLLTYAIKEEKGGEMA
jgi:RsiW-degrading membrane proteinase PrsW (M82 family)